MGAGDLNVKKSWHPRLQRNQEKVWKQEQEVLAERKKLDELRKEREQERQMQELQRIHEAAGGKRRSERVEWMYATPATSTGPSESELEDYLLGKKRVDKLLQGNEAQQLSRTAGPAVLNEPEETNTAKDMALKVREDPLFAIKKQEQAMYEMLMKDPTRMRQMRARLGLPVEKDERLDRSRRAHNRDRDRDRDRDRHHRHRHRDHHSDRHDRHRSDRYEEWSSRRHESRDRDEREYDRRHYDNHRPYDERYRPENYDRRERDDYARQRDREARHDKDSFRSSRRHYDTPSRHRSRSPNCSRVTEEDRAAKLAEMMQNAKTMEADRASMIAKVTEEEQKEQEEEEQRRDKAHNTGKASFLLDQQLNLWGEQSGGMDLHERLRRGRHALERVQDDS